MNWFELNFLDGLKLVELNEMEIS